MKVNKSSEVQQYLRFSFKQGLRVLLANCRCGERSRQLINSCFFSTCTASDSTFHLGWNPQGRRGICVYVAALESLRTRLLTAALLKMEVGPRPQRKGGHFFLYLCFQTNHEQLFTQTIIPQPLLLRLHLTCLMEQPEHTSAMVTSVCTVNFKELKRRL